MALIPTREEVYEIPGGPGADIYEVGLEKIVTRVAYYRDSGTGEEVMIEKDVSLYSSVDGGIVRRDEYRWEYFAYGTPPEKTTHRIYAKVYVPGVSYWSASELPLIAEITTDYDPFSPFTTADRRVVERKRYAGYIIYTKKQDNTGPTDEGKAKLAERGMTTEGPTGIAVGTGKPLLQAVKDNGIIDLPDAPQEAVWFDPYRTETKLEVLQFDGIVRFGVRMDHYRQGYVDITGPDFTKKEGFSYSFNIDLSTPDVEAIITTKNNKKIVRITATGGCARVDAFDGYSRRVRPDGYRIYREKISDGTPVDTDDPAGLWDITPPTSTRGTFVISPGAEEFDGTPTSSTPPQELYDEPGEPDYGQDNIRESIADIKADPGSLLECAIGEADDEDIIPGADFRYIAVAYLGDSVSPEGYSDVITHPPTNSVLYSIKSSITGDDSTTVKEVDITAPEDSALGDIETGTTEVYDVPVYNDDDIETVAEDVGKRVFSRDSETRVSLDITLTSVAPILSIERGQIINIPELNWKAIGNGIVADMQMIEKDYVVDGFRISVSVNGDGSANINPILYLEEV